MFKKPTVLIGALVAIAVLGGTFYLLNREFDLLDKIPGFKDDTEIAICDGNICKINHTDKTTEMLVYKEDYEEVEEFTEVYESPDGDYMCFLAQTIVPMWVYFAETDGTDVTKVDLAENCVWSHDSSMFAYTNHTTDVSPHDVHVYDLSTKEITNYTESVNSIDLMRVYEKPVWSDDDKKITSKYTQNDSNSNWAETTGESQITLESGEIEEV